jgi:hypothetical protein
MPLRGHELGAPARLAAFVVVLAVVGGAAALAGKATGDGRAPASHAEAAMSMDEAASAQANGLASVAGGYSFVPARSTLPLGKAAPYRFTILDSKGKPVRDFDVDGGVRLHLIVVRRDYLGYQHLHPSLAGDGTWSVPLTLRDPGAYRAYADFEVDGVKTVLGNDISVPGRFTPERMPDVRPSVVIDGYTVTLRHDTLRAGKETRLRFAIGRGGRPVPSFDSYVGHRGHLVALHDGDLAYSHVHPEPVGGRGEIDFHTQLSAAGRYRLFLQFKVDGVVHTAPFTVEVAR